MTADGGRRMSDRLTVFLGVLALAGIAMLGAVILIVVSAAAVVGFAMGLLVMPWLMPLVRTFFRWKGRLRDLPRPRRKDTPAAQGPPEKLLTTGRGPVPAHRGGPRHGIPSGELAVDPAGAGGRVGPLLQAGWHGMRHGRARVA